MSELIRQFGVTAILMCIIIAGGKKTHAYLIGIYGCSYMLSTVIKLLMPLFKVSSHIPGILSRMPI